MRQGCLVLFAALIPWLGIPAHALAQPEDFESQFADTEGEEEEEELETDRDAFTPATSTVGRCLTVFESSYTFIDNRDVAETHSFPEILVRRGVTDRLELRIGWNYEVGGAGDLVSGEEGGEEFTGGEIERESQLLYGFKVAVTEQAGWMPRSAIILQGYSPTSGESNDSDFLATYTFGWELANRWRLDSSLHYLTEHAAEDAFNQWAPSVILRMPVNERWNMHVEYFGIYSEGAEREFSRAFISPGTHYLVTPNLELGARIGWGITDDAPNFFSNIGVGWRF
jgi:hypothetical protein